MESSSTTAWSATQGLRPRLRQWLESLAFQRFIMTVIVINAITLGFETWPEAVATAGSLLLTVDHLALSIFCCEILLKLYAYGWRFFKNGWNWFDFGIVAIALIPTSSGLSVLRALRILRALRLISVVPQMRTVVQALLSSLPGMGAIGLLLLLVYYVASVMATKLFGAAFPEWFGSLGASMYTLFQIMTLESWSMGIVRPVMETYPQAWLFFVPFIVLTSFAVLNLFIGLIVNSLQLIQEQNAQEKGPMAEAPLGVAEELRALRQEVEALRVQLQQSDSSR